MYHVQCLSKFHYKIGQRKVRVTTLARNWTDAAANLDHIKAGFDQECASFYRMQTRYATVDGY